MYTIPPGVGDPLMIQGNERITGELTTPQIVGNGGTYNGFTDAGWYAIAGGDAIVGMAAAPFRKGGVMDLVTACDSTVQSVYLGTGAGAFGAATTFTTKTCNWVATGDFTNTGVQSIAFNTIGSGVGGIGILLGTGTGSFGAQVTYEDGNTINQIQSVVTGKFNLTVDANTDVAVIGNAGFYPGIATFLGTGTGSFGTANTNENGTSTAFSVVGDFNGDGYPDILDTAPANGRIETWLGTGAGNFSTPINTSVTGAEYVAIGDFNEDGKLDAVVSSSSSYIEVFLGLGTGHFGSGTTYAAGTAPEQIVVADFNADGHADVAVANLTDNTIGIFLGTGKGTFAAETTIALSGTLAANAALITADFNGDGYPDLAIADTQSSVNGFQVLLNNYTAGTSLNLTGAVVADGGITTPFVDAGCIGLGGTIIFNDGAQFYGDGHGGITFASPDGGTFNTEADIHSTSNIEGQTLTGDVQVNTPAVLVPAAEAGQPLSIEDSFGYNACVLLDGGTVCGPYGPYSYESTGHCTILHTSSVCGFANATVSPTNGIVSCSSADTSCLAQTCGVFAGWGYDAGTILVNSLGVCLDTGGCRFNCTLVNP